MDKKLKVSTVPKTVDSGYLKISNRIFFDIEKLESGRLILDFPESAFLDDLFEQASNPNVTKYLTWNEHKTIDDTSDFLMWAKSMNDSKENAIWIIKDKASGKSIGSIGIHKHGDIHEIGFWLGESYWGKGLVSEALGAVDEFATKKGIGELVGKHVEENVGSGKVFLKNGYEDTLFTETVTHKDGTSVSLKIYKKILN